jgi:glutathione S-transferase
MLAPSGNDQQRESEMLTILGRATSANVQKVTWLCDECKIEFKREDIGGPFGGNDKPEYLKLNPNGRVPCVIDDGFVIWESNAILQYLGSKHAQGSWYPTDLKARGRAVQWMDWALSTYSTAHGPVFMGLIRTPADKRDMTAIGKARDGWSKQVAMLDNHLAGSKYIAGDTITIGDMPVAIFTWRWFGLPIQRENYANVKRWYDSIAARPAFKKNVIDIGLS